MLPSKINEAACILCKQIVNNVHKNEICNHAMCENCLNTKKRKLIDCNSCESMFNKYSQDDEDSLIKKERGMVIKRKKGEINGNIEKLKNDVGLAIDLMIGDLQELRKDIFRDLDTSRDTFIDKLDVNIYENKLLSFHKHIQSSQEEMKHNVEYYNKELHNFDEFIENFEQQKLHLLNIVQNIESSDSKTLSLNFKIKSLCKLSNERVVVCNYRKPYFKIYDENLNTMYTIDNLTQQPLDVNNNESMNEVEDVLLLENYNSIACNKSDYIYLTSNNSILMADDNFNLIKVFSDAKKFKFLSDVVYANANNSIYVCDSSSKKIHKLSTSLDYLKKYRFVYEPLKIEIINETICILPQYDTQEINCLHLYDLNTFNFKFNFAFDHYGPIGVIGDLYFCLYDYENAMLHLIHQNGYLNDSASIEIDKKKFHLCDKIFDLNAKLYVTSSINEKIFHLSNN